MLGILLSTYPQNITLQLATHSQMGNVVQSNTVCNTIRIIEVSILLPLLVQGPNFESLISIWGYRSGSTNDKDSRLSPSFPIGVKEVAPLITRDSRLSHWRQRTDTSDKQGLKVESQVCYRCPRSGTVDDQGLKA